MEPAAPAHRQTDALETKVALPRVTIDLDAVGDATRRLADALHVRGLRLNGVTKCVDGEPAVGRAMLAAGASGLADSRVPSLARLAAHGLGRSRSSAPPRRTNSRRRRGSPTACSSATPTPRARSGSSREAAPSRSC